MSEEQGAQEKQLIYDEIEKLRSEVSKNPEIRLRAQEDVFEYLDTAIQHLESGDSVQCLHNTYSQLEMARKRALQASKQSELLPWLPMILAVFLLSMLGITAWLMVVCKSCLFSPTPSWLDILFGAALWGAVGSTGDGLRELRTRLARQELDPVRSLWYFTHPFIGAVAGSILFLVIYAGLLAISDNNTNYSPALIFAIAAVGGFSQRQVIQYFRDTLVKILNIQKEPQEEAG